MSNTDLAALKVAKIKCERDLLFFTRYFYLNQYGSKFIVADLHQQIADALMLVFRGEVKNLIINIPPRYGKTQLAVQSFIAWCLLHNPKAQFIHLSYSDQLALDNSGKIMETINSAEYQQFWQLKLRPDTQSKKLWYTTEGGGVYATAAGGAITGFGAGRTSPTGLFDGAIIIDDPLKVDDAVSDIERNKVNDRLNGTIKSRRNHRDTPIIIIMQRLHEDDMTGFALAGGMGEHFHHLVLKALKDDGTALWEYKHTVEELKKMQITDPYGFSGQYQQEPSPEDGEYFKREWVQWYEDIPKHLKKYGASDYAVTDQGGDYTVHMIGGVDPNDDLYIIDMWRGQSDSLVWVDAKIEMIKEHRPTQWAVEKGQILRSIGPLLEKRQREERAFCFMHEFASSGDKEMRAQSMRGRMAQRKVFFPRNAPWVEGLIREMMQFPNGKYDDQVDTFGLMGRLMTQMAKAQVPKEKDTRLIGTSGQTIAQMIAAQKRKRLTED